MSNFLKCNGRRSVGSGTMCILMFLSGCGGVHSQSGYEKFKQKEEGFVSAVVSAGGSAKKENKSMFGLTKLGWIVDLSGANISEQLVTQIIEAGKMDPVFRLDFSNSKITNEQLARLDRENALEKTVELDLSNTAITDEGLDRLSNLRWITVLNITGAGATKTAAKKLGEKKIANPDTPLQFKTQIDIKS